MTDALREDEPFIRAHGVGFTHGASAVLRDVSFALRRGRHYVIAGQNGAGKSTLLDILANLKRPRTGELTIGGRRPSERSRGESARITALAPQEFRFDFSFTVREIVAMGRRPYLDSRGGLTAGDTAVVNRVLGEMRLSDLAERSVLTLSGGEKRRCVIARALAQETPALLLDEPDSGLDVRHALAVMALAGELARGGRLVVTVSHDLNLAARFADDFLFLKKGSLVAFGAVHDVFTDAVLSDVYETPARVSRDEFTGSPTATFQIADNGRQTIA